MYGIQSETSSAHISKQNIPKFTTELNKKYKAKLPVLLFMKMILYIILIHYVCNAHFHWLWRRKFAALKS